jgi:hypothetical protein
MRPLRLPHRSTRSLRFPSQTGSLVAFRVSLAGAAENPALAPGRWFTGVVLIRCFEGAVWRSQLFRKPPCASAPLSDPGPVSTPVACVPFGVRLTVGVSMLSPLAKNRKTRAIKRLSGFNYAAYALAPYASCAPCSDATQCLLPGGCQPFPGRTGYPLGFIYMFIHPFVCFLMYCLLARFAQRLSSAMAMVGAERAYARSVTNIDIALWRLP